MRVCLVCNHENPVEAIQCAKCGAPLRVSETVTLSGEVQQGVIRHFKEHDIDLEPGLIAFGFVGKSEPLIVPADDGLILGRNIANDQHLAVDLSAYHAGLLGVSRRHAAIVPSGAGYAITDLGSTNGTWVNENRLSPQVPYELQNRDQIRLGELIMFIFFSVD